MKVAYLSATHFKDYQNAWRIYEEIAQLLLSVSLVETHGISIIVKSYLCLLLAQEEDVENITASLLDMIPQECKTFLRGFIVISYRMF